MIADVTVVVLTLDEELRVGPTLRAAREAGFRVLVVDGGSIDRTVVVAQAAGCEVAVRQFGGFAEQRNWALAAAATPYVLFVDADELVHPALVREVTSAIARGVDGAWVPTLDYFAGRWMLHGGWYPQPHLRLLRRSVACFEGAVHERVRFSSDDATVVHLTEPLLHRSHLTVSDYLRKLDRYTEIEARGRLGRPGLLLCRGAAESMAVFIRRLLLQSGWRDGAHGFVGAALYGMYRFTIYAKAATAKRVDSDSPESGIARLRQRVQER